MLWKKKERFKVRVVQMDNLRGLLRELYRVKTSEPLEMKGLMKVCSSGSAMWRGWREIGLPREFM